MKQVQFTQDVAITALGGRFAHGDVVEVPDDTVDFLINGGYAVVVNDEPINESRVPVDGPGTAVPAKTKHTKKAGAGDPDDKAKG